MNETYYYPKKLGLNFDDENVSWISVEVSPKIENQEESKEEIFASFENMIADRANEKKKMREAVEKYQIDPK